VTDLLFARGIDVGIVQTDVLEALKKKPPFPDVEKVLAVHCETVRAGD